MALWPVLLWGCAGQGDAGPTAARDSQQPSDADTGRPEAPDGALGCPVEALEERGTVSIDDPALDEVSGLVVSTADTEVWWVHNDSGDEPRVFALSGPDEQVLGTILLDGVGHRDFEDLALGPCGAERDCLFVGDIGDNDAAYDSVTVHRFEEPAPTDAEVAVESETLRWADGPVDCEAMWVDWSDGTLWFATKELGQTRIGQAVDGVITHVATLPIEDGLVTGADARPGTLVLRTYVSILVFSGPPDASMTALIDAEPLRLEVTGEGQGEAVALFPGGLITGSEGTPAVFHPWECPMR